MIRHIAGLGRKAQRQPQMPVEDVPCRLDKKLTLGQFLKLAGVIESGAEAKLVIADGEVEVNGEVETRRGRGLVAGDEVTCAGRCVRVVEEEAQA